MVKMLAALESTVSNSQLFLLKNVSSIKLCVIFNYQSFNDTLTNNR